MQRRRRKPEYNLEDTFPQKAVAFLWDVFSKINDIVLYILTIVFLPLTMASLIHSGILVFHILALTTMPIWLAKLAGIANIAAIMFLIYDDANNRNRNKIEMIMENILRWCATLFCFHSFLLAGSAIIPAAITAVILGYLALEIATLMPKFFHSTANDINIANTRYYFNHAKYMAAHIIALAVMGCMFKFASAAIITAVSPYAVAILCAISAATITASLHSITNNYEEFAFEKKSPLENTIDTILFAGAAVTLATAAFLVVTKFQLTLACAPMIIAAYTSFQAGVLAKQLVFIIYDLTSKLLSNLRNKSESKIIQGECASQKSTGLKNWFQNLFPCLHQPAKGYSKVDQTNTCKR